MEVQTDVFERMPVEEKGTVNPLDVLLAKPVGARELKPGKVTLRILKVPACDRCGGHHCPNKGHVFVIAEIDGKQVERIRVGDNLGEKSAAVEVIESLERDLMKRFEEDRERWHERQRVFEAGMSYPINGLQRGSGMNFTYGDS